MIVVGALLATGFSATVEAQNARPFVEYRLVAKPDAERSGPKFEMDREVLRLRAWLNVTGNRDAVRLLPQRVREFNLMSPERGGSLNRDLHWFPHSVSADRDDPKKWERAFFDNIPGVMPLFAAEDFAKGPQNPTSRLVELVPVDMRAGSFSDLDFEAGSVRAGADPDSGRPALFYTIAEDSREAFGDWTEKHIDRVVTVLIDGQVRTVSTLRGRITMSGVIVGLNESENWALARAIGDRVLAGQGATEVIGAGDGMTPSGSDPADLRAMQGAQAMLAAERRLRELLDAGKIEGVDKILTFEEIESWPYEDGLLGMPPKVKALDGTEVLMTGFMLPIDEVENIKEFLLVQSLWSCCYGQPPDINGIVRVVMQGDARLDYQFDPIKVIGTFRVEATYEDGYCVDIFQLDASSVEVIR